MGVTIRQKVPGKGNPWWIFITHAGKRTSRQVGDKKAAETAASQIRAQLQLGEFNFEETKKPSTPVFKDYAEGFMDTYSAMNHKFSTQKSYRDSLDNYLIPKFGDMLLDGITRKHVKEFIQELHGKELKSATIRNHKAYLSSIMSEAVDDEIIQVNPARMMGKRIKKDSKEAKDKISPLTWEESDKYLDTARAHYPRHYPMCLTLCRTGMRLGEVVALQPGDLDFNGRFIEVRRSYSKGRITTPKTGEGRRVDMSGQLAEVLKAHLVERKKETLRNGWKEPPEWLFYDTQGGLLDEDHWRRRVHSKILEKAGLRHVRIHDLRHTYATLRLSKGDNILDVSKQLGHASVKMTLDVYAHWIPGGKKSEVDGLDSRTAPVGNGSQGVEAKNG